jgi:Rps23 Pro-64 3,4-dihydroxylase Tpa1-like proline 4-hydroxylase
MQFIEHGVQSRTIDLGAQFDSARPFRHVVIDGFVNAEYCQALCDQFPAFDPAHARNEMGEVGRKAVYPNLRDLGPAYQQFDALLRSPEFLAWVGAVTGIEKLLYDPDYVGGGTHENLNGQDLDNHVDFNYHPVTRFHRRLNLILFLNPGWKPEWGGSLELQKDPYLPESRNLIRSILPLANRCVLFETTESSWHGFRTITLPEDRQNLSRRSIAVYFYTRIRPRHETAAGHGTIYVHRPAPEFVQPGHTLSECDVHELQAHFSRRDDYIRFLYEREKEFTRITQSPSFRLARALTWPLRKVRSAFSKG